MSRSPETARRPAAAALLLVGLALATATAQEKKPRTDSARAARREAREQAALERAQSGDTTGLHPARLFTDDGILDLTLTANFGQLRRDREDAPPWRWARITYAGGDGAPVDIPLEVRSRGIWRRRNCDLPPLRLRFQHARVKDTPFAKQRRVKLVVHCHDRDEYEQYVLAEFQLYRVYNALTPLSHLVRLARISYVDSGSARPFATRYAFFEEDPEAMATRNAAIVVAQQGARPGDLDGDNEALLGTFEYFIGNTDFSISQLHNVELLQRAMHYYGVAHDFDFSGAVDARYATTDPRLPIRTVRDRYYLGFCTPEQHFGPVFALFAARKDTIFALYRDAYGRLLAPDRVRATLDYFDAFYRAMADQRRMTREIAAGCIDR